MLILPFRQTIGVGCSLLFKFYCFHVQGYPKWLPYWMWNIGHSSQRRSENTFMYFFFFLKIYIIVLELLRTGENKEIWVVQEAVSVHIKLSFGVQCFSGWIHQSLIELCWSIPVVVLLSPDYCKSTSDACSKLTLQLAPSRYRIYIYLVQFSHLVISSSLCSQGLQYARLRFPSPTPRACSILCP